MKSDTYLYDADASQTIPFEVEKNNRIYKLSHVLQPLSDERYFQLEREKHVILKKSVKNQSLTTELYKPLETLWDELATDRIGAKPSETWKEKTHYLDKVQVVNGLLGITIIEDKDESDDDLLFDDDEGFTIQAHALQSGALLTVSHHFRQETKAEMDEYIAIIADKPKPNSLASAINNQLASERYCDLYDALAVSNDGYKSRVPAWHKIAVVTAHLSNQLGRVGKSLNA